MARATLNWTLPTTRVDGAALAQGDIDFTDISMSADGGANFSPPIQVPADAAQTFVVDDLVGGTYIFRAVVQDTQGRRSANADQTADVTIADPSAIADLTVTVE
jgi:hypothetical protein